MKLDSGNLLNAPVPAAGAEHLDALLQTSAVRIDRIVSNGHRSPDNHWYDQTDDEFVVVIAGDATLQFADGATKEMHTGDWLLIPAHLRHRIVRSSERTIWLAIHAATLKP